MLLSCGDPAGIGPEIAIKVASQANSSYIPVITGAFSVINQARTLFAPDKKLILWGEAACENSLFYEDFSCFKIKDFEKGKNSAVAGELAYQTIVKTTQAVQQGIFDAIVTAPVSKEAINLAGYQFQGHTELIAQLCKTKNFVMMQSSEQLNVAFMSNHIPLMHAKEFITQKRLKQVIALFHNALQKNSQHRPKIAIAGFNPHAGENGFIGKEENKIIIPTIQELSTKYNLFGPFASDTIFIKKNRRQFDGIISMYHDQGHIPFKMLSFDTGVNCTLGLPIVRTSVDHGTAFDIAWQGKAFTTSLQRAIKKAVFFASNL